MNTFLRNTLKLSILIMVLTALFGAGRVSAASLPATPCTGTGTVTCELWATTGTTTLYGSTAVNIWGYSTSSTPDTATLPGPALIVNQGDTVNVILHNNLSESTSLLFQGLELMPDLTGIAAGATYTYTFGASTPGTYLYEAGIIPGLQHQVAMGMYGALVVKPADGTAYGTPGTAYDEEQLLVLSEFDTALAANPTSFEMRDYAPRYFLVNGKAYDSAFSGDIPVTAGNKVLLRYVNAGLQAHAMGTLGIAQSVIAADGHALTHPHSMVAETIATGQTLDTLVTIPAGTLDGTKFAVYDANLMLRNSNAVGLGGMLTFLAVGTPPPPPGGDTTGPQTSGETLTPNPTNGSVAVNVSASVSDASTGGSPVTAAEFYIDNTNGVATPMSGAFGSITVSASGTISTGTLATLASGNHVIYVRGLDSFGNWGAFSSATLILDKVGPTTSALGLSPNPTNGTSDVVLTATANDSASGNSNVTAAEYTIDGGPATSMTVSAASPITSLSATISAATVNGLSSGSHLVSVRSQDALGNWGGSVSITLKVDKVSPITSSVTASPNPNNGNQGFNTSVPAVRVFATFNDGTTGGSNIAGAELFFGTIGQTGSGTPFIATDGSFNSPLENGYADIPLPVIANLPDGNYTIYVHARDAAGNWGDPSLSTTILRIQKGLYFSTLGTSNPPGVSGTADDADIYLWNGSAYSRSIDVTAITNPLPNGANVDGFDRVDNTHFYLSFSGDVTIALPGPDLSVQDEDIVYYNAGVWSVYFDGTARGLTNANQDIDAFNIVGSTIYFSTLGNTNPPGVGGTADDADIYSWNGTSFARVWDATAAGFASGANVDGVVWIDATHFYLSFATDTAVPGLGTVQDEDVVLNNGGTWSVYFDGTAHGLTSNSLDIDAFDLP